VESGEDFLQREQQDVDREKVNSNDGKSSVRKQAVLFEPQSQT
jgi:hypothetical protein